MNKSQIKRTLKKASKGAEFISQNAIKGCMGWGNDRTYETLKGLDWIRRGRTKQYMVDEVADRIFAQVERSWDQ